MVVDGSVGVRSKYLTKHGAETFFFMMKHNFNSSSAVLRTAPHYCLKEAEGRAEDGLHEPGNLANQTRSVEAEEHEKNDTVVDELLYGLCVLDNQRKQRLKKKCLLRMLLGSPTKLTKETRTGHSPSCRRPSSASPEP